MPHKKNNTRNKGKKTKPINPTETTQDAQYPKSTSHVPYHNKKIKKLDVPQISHTDRLINNFIIHQNLPMAPRDLKHLITNDKNGVVDVISLYGRQIIIMILHYPSYDPKRCQKNLSCQEEIAAYPSYICAFDYQTYDILDVVPVLGGINCFEIWKGYITINIFYTPNATESQLITYALTVPNFKFQQIQPAFNIGSDGLNIIKISMNYITIPEPNTTNSAEIQPQGRLIIHAVWNVVYYKERPNDILLTYNHFRDKDQEYWQFHKSALIQYMEVDISKYTHTDIFPARDVEYVPHNAETLHPLDPNYNEIHRIVSLSMDKPDINYPLSELRRPILKRYLRHAVNEYILHPDGQLELILQDDKGIPLYSGKTAKRKTPVCEYYYPSEKVGLEVIYTTEISNPLPETDGSLVFDSRQITVKNNSDAYHLQPGNILKYACMNHLISSQKKEVFSTPVNSHNLKIEIEKLFYSADGKYLAIEIPKRFYYYHSETYDLNGVILYNRNAENGRWREISYISFEKYYGQKQIAFKPADNQLGEHLGYNLWITVKNSDKFPEFVVIPTPIVLAQKYNDLLGGVFPVLAQSNINNISKFLANQKTKFIDLQSEKYKDNTSKAHIGYKHLKLNL